MDIDRLMSYVEEAERKTRELERENVEMAKRVQVGTIPLTVSVEGVGML